MMRGKSFTTVNNNNDKSNISKRKGNVVVKMMGRKGTRRCSLKWVLVALFFGVAFIMVIVATSSLVFLSKQQQPTTDSQQQREKKKNEEFNQAIMKRIAAAAAKKKGHQEGMIDSCEFRKYPPHRYYKLMDSQQTEFLKTADYMFGKKPILLSNNGKSSTKLCVDQSPWLQQQQSSSQQWPFADGTNPSILSLKRIFPSKDSSTIINIPEWYKNMTQNQSLLPSNVEYIATICMTNSQCSWNDSPQQIQEYQLSTQTKPTTVRTLLLFLNANFDTVFETTIYLERNARWGRKTPPARKKTTQEQELNNDSSPWLMDIRALDDARLFVYRNQIWISFREGPGFGYDKQVLNPLHITWNQNDNNNNNNNDFDDYRPPRISAIIRASETKTLCCGRNMALLEEEEEGGGESILKSLTWVDPVTVISVFPPTKRRRLEEQQHDALIFPNTTMLQQLLDNQLDHGRRRRLGQQERNNDKKKSHVHGTNAFMVPYRGNKKNNELLEYLGMAHIHRPPDRKSNPLARFGHHYTHAFFTIARASNNKDDFYLSRLSQEFLLPSNHYDNDGEVIQFISGLEVVPSKQMIILAYGINDCEGAAVQIPIHVVENMLQPISQGQQVVDIMKPVESW